MCKDRSQKRKINMELSISGVSRGIYVWKKNLISVSQAHMCVPFKLFVVTLK